MKWNVSRGVSKHFTSHVNVWTSWHERSKRPSPQINSDKSIKWEKRNFVFVLKLSQFASSSKHLHQDRITFHVIVLYFICSFWIFLFLHCKSFCRDHIWPVGNTCCIEWFAVDTFYRLPHKSINIWIHYIGANSHGFIFVGCNGQISLAMSVFLFSTTYKIGANKNME